jgi:hypothetical protein
MDEVRAGWRVDGKERRCTAAVAICQEAGPVEEQEQVAC